MKRRVLRGLVICKQAHRRIRLQSHPSSRALSTETCSSIMIAWAVRSAAPKRQSAASICSKPTSCWPSSEPFEVASHQPFLVETAAGAIRWRFVWSLPDGKLGLHSLAAVSGSCWRLSRQGRSGSTKIGERVGVLGKL